MYSAEPQKAIIAGNYTRDLDFSERACVAAYLNEKMFSLMLKKHCLF